MLEACGADKDATCESHVLREWRGSSAVDSTAATCANTLLQAEYALVSDCAEIHAILQGRGARFLHKACVLRL